LGHGVRTLPGPPLPDGRAYCTILYRISGIIRRSEGKEEEGWKEIVNEWIMEKKGPKEGSDERWTGLWDQRGRNIRKGRHAPNHNTAG